MDFSNTSLITHFKTEKIHGTFQKKPSKSEISERLWRADPGDGLKIKDILKNLKIRNIDLQSNLNNDHMHSIQMKFNNITP